MDPGKAGVTGAIDFVSGHTTQQIFNALDGDVTSPAAVRDRSLQENGNSQSACAFRTD
jgi:hypothetical protein